MLCVLILAAPRLFSPALPPSLRQTLWALSSAAVKPAALTPRAVMPLLEANAWTDMKRKLQQLQLPAAERPRSRRTSPSASPRRSDDDALRKENLLRPIYTYHCRVNRAAAAARTNVRKNSAEHVDRKLPRKKGASPRRCH